MRATIARKVGALLVVLAGGAMVALATFFWFLDRTAGEIDTILVTDHLRIHSRLLYDLADRKVWDEGDRRYVGRVLPLGDQALAVLRNGGEVLNHQIPALPPEMAETLARIEDAWRRLRAVLEVTVRNPVDSPAALAARQGMHPAAPELDSQLLRLQQALDARAKTVRRQTLYTMVGLCAAGMALLAAGLWITQRYIVRQVRLIEEGVRHVQDGDFAHRVPVVSGDEVARLATAFNKMSAHIAVLLEERDRSEAAVRESQRRLDLALKAADIGLWSLDTRTNELYLSPRSKAQIGYEDHEFPNRAEEWISHLHPDDKQRVIEAEQSFVANPGSEFKHEFRLRHKDGSYRWILSRGSMSFDAEGKPLRMTGFHIDVTEQRNLAEQLRQAQKMDALGKLAGGVAHDFNNLLTVIRGYTELILAELEPGSGLRNGAEEILVASERAQRLTAQLLTFSRKQVIQPRILDLNEVVLGMERLLRRLIGEHIALRTQTAADLGKVNADPGQIEQVILNLTVNSRDAMPGGGVLALETANVDLHDDYARAHVGCPPGPYVMLAVSDTGHGMDEQTRARVFEPFFTTKERGAASGLGLAMVHGIVRQGGGHVQVYSEPGIGTTFRIYFPRVEDGRPATAKAERPVDAPPLGGRETILLVEDEAAVRRLVRLMLAQLGYTVLEADSAVSAHEQCRTAAHPIHLLLTDVVMPGKSGSELASELVQARPGLKVLYMSGYTDDAISHHGVLEPGVALIEKPFTLQALAAKVRQALG